MPGPLFHQTGVATCMHQTGVISFVPTNQRVRVLGMSVAVASDVFSVAGCVFTLPNGTPHPCVLATLAPAARVQIMGSPAVVTVGPTVTRAADQVPQGIVTHSANQPRVTAL